MMIADNMRPEGGFSPNSWAPVPLDVSCHGIAGGPVRSCRGRSRHGSNVPPPSSTPSPAVAIDPLEHENMINPQVTLTTSPKLPPTHQAVLTA